MWSRPTPSPWHIYKDDLMKLNLQTVSFAADAMRMLNGARLSVNGQFSMTGVYWLTAAGLNFSSTTALRFADLEGLPSNKTMGPVNARPLQDVKLNHDEGNREERPGRFLTTRASIGQHVKMFRQVKAPPGHVKERAYPKQVNQEGDVQRYGGLKAMKKDETIFAAYDKAEMRKAKIMIVANSDFVYTSKSLFWPDVIMLAAVDLDLTQSVSMAIGVQRQIDMNPITIVFAGINDHLHSRGFQIVKGEEGFGRTDNMLKGLKAGWTASFLAKLYPKFSRYLIKEFLQAVVEVSIVELLALFVTFGAENFVKGPVVLLTEGIQNLRLDGLLTLIAITHGNLGGLTNLTRYPEQMRENVRKFDLK